MGCGRSSNRNCDRTELLRCLLFPDFTQNWYRSSDQSRFYACLRHECPPDEAWYSCCIPEYHHRCGRSGSPVCDQWLRFPFCSRIYSYKQALWSVGNGCYFLWICHRYLCGSESGSQKDWQDQKRRPQQYAAFPTDLTNHFCCHVFIWKKYSLTFHLRWTAADTAGTGNCF